MGAEVVCFNVWDSNNLPVEVAYSSMCLLFALQAAYAVKKRAKIAI